MAKTKKKKKQRQSSQYSAPIAEYRKRTTSNKKSTSAKKTASKQTTTSKNSRLMDVAPIRQRESSQYKTTSEYRKTSSKTNTSAKKSSTSARKTAQKQTSTSKNSRLQDVAPIRTRTTSTYSTPRSDYNKRDKVANSTSALSRSKNSRVLDNPPDYDFFKKSGAFKDGYQFGDVTKTVGSTVADVGIGMTKGAGRMVEGLTDAGHYLIANGADALGNDEFADKLRVKAQENAIDRMFGDVHKRVKENSILSEKVDAVTEGLGQVATVLLTGGVAGALGAGTAGATALTTGVMGASSFGSGMSEAYQGGATDEEATKYGLIKGTVDAGTELIFGGLGKAVKATGLSKGISSLDDAFALKLSSKISDQTLKNLAEFGVKASAEGVEEVLAGIGGAVGKKLTYMEDEELRQLVEDEQLLEQFIVGAVTSGIAQSGYVPGMSQGSLREANKTGRDFITGYTQSEQAVIDKEVENRSKDALEKKIEEQKRKKLDPEIRKAIDESKAIHGEELTEEQYKAIIEEVKSNANLSDEEFASTKLDNKEISKITDKVIKDLERGEIDTFTITNTLFRDNALRQRELNNELETATPERKAEIEAELEELHTSFNKELEKNYMLQESYNQEKLRGEKLEYKLSENASEKAKKIVESAMSAGENNSRASHERIDFLIKMADASDYDIVVANDSQLKKLGYYDKALGKNMENLKASLSEATTSEEKAKIQNEINNLRDSKTVTINGLKKDGKIIVNIDSKNAIQTIVGHEITHFTEKGGNYKNLNKVITEYAKSIGDYGHRITTQGAVYKKNNPKITAEGIEQEVIADLVGEYVFTDEDFIRSLSAKEPSTFESIRDYIKHAFKMATAGSSEARQLEKAKRMFEKVYRETSNIKADTETKHWMQETVTNVSDKLNSSECEQVKSAVANHTKLNYQYKKSSKGDIIIPVNNKLVYTDANFDSPGISKVIEFNSDVETEIDEARRWIYEAEKGEYTLTDAYEIIEGLTGNEFISEYNQESSESAEKYDRRTSRGKSKSDSYHANFMQDRIRRANEIIHSVNDSKASSEDGVFFDGKYSLSEDTNGNKLSDKQKEYFKDSKIVDENGNLKVMYHGSQESFTVFDKRKAKASGLYGKGFYFTESKSHAQQYGSQYEVYLNITNPIQNGTNNITKDQLRNFVEALAENEDYGIENYGYGATVDSITDDIYGKDDFAMLMDLNVTCVGNMVEAIELFNEVNGTDYNGIVAPTETVAFYPNQIKKVDNQSPTADADIRYSLSEDEYAPIKSEFAPLTEAEANERDAMQNGRLQSLNENDMPPEIAPDYGENPIEEVNPFDKRDIKDVGDRKVKAYMYENPEVKPYFQEEAQIMLRELQDSIKGERTFNDQLYYDTGGEQGWFATKRQTSDEIAYLLDNFPYTYADIEKGLKAIIEDHGAENNAVSKRIEFMIDERLREGYTDFTSGMDIPNNPDYIALLEHKQITEYNDEAYNRWIESLANTEEFAPVKPSDKKQAKPKQATKDIAPVKDTGKAEAPKVKGTTEQQQIASVLAEEPKTESQRNKRKWAIFKANVFDKGAVFEDLSIKKKNRELMGKWNYTLYSEARAQRLMGNGNPESNVKSLNAIREEVESTGLTKQFYEYMYHKHNVDRMNLEGRFDDVQNKPVFGFDVTSEMSQEIVDQYEFAEPRFMDFAQDVYDYMKHLRQQLVDNGVISQKTADLWQNMYPHYVPIRRVDDTGLNVNVPLDTGRTGVNAPIKRATGGNTDILPLFDTMGMRTMQTFKATAKNSFGVELKNTLGGETIKAPTTVDELIDSIDAQDSLLQEGKNGSKPTFTVFENGERVTFEITEDMYDALKPVSDSSLLSKTIKPLNIASNIHRGLLTEYNPVFMLNNAIKDVQDVLMNSQHATRTYLKIPEAHKQMLTKGYWYNEYMANGGEQNTYFDNESNTFATEKKGVSKALDILPLRAISTANNYIEMIPRLAEYIASREAGRSVEVSMLDSARVTTNFRAGGDLAKFVNRNGGTFLNASIQGAMQQVRNVREANMNGLKGWANLATKFAIAGVPTFLLNNMLWDDDDDYEELSDYVKQSYYVIGKYGDGQFIRIPKGRTVAVIQEGIRQIGNATSGNDEADLKSYLEFVISNLAPNNPLENNVLAPIMQVANNETWYGEDLVPSRLQDVPVNEQYDESTDSFSRFLGDKLNISPIKINYLLDQYSGGIGDVVLPMLTPEAESGDDSLVGNLLAPLKKKFTTDSVMNNQNVSDFYALSDELTLNANKSNATEEDKLRNKYINAIKSEMGELYQEKRDIQSAGWMSDEMKYNEVREIQKKIDLLAEDALNTYDSINISGRYAMVGDKHFLMNEEYGWRTLNEEQVEKQEKASALFGISASEYWDNDDDKYVYDWAVKNPEYYQVSRAISNDVFTYWKHNDYMWNNIRADKDENGKSISGSKKKKIIDYINNIDDLEYEEKLVLFKKYYPADDTYNQEIIDYLNSRDDISYEEMETILKELDFEVDEDGNIYW